MKENSSNLYEEHEFERLDEMKNMLLESGSEHLPAKFWVITSEKHIAQLKEKGYENFKKTIALNYFTWVIKTRRIWQDDQLKFLSMNLPPLSVLKNALRAVKAIFTNKFRTLSFVKLVLYNFLVHMLWDYVSRLDYENILKKIEEPIEGNPPKIYLKKTLISQDLANSALEYFSIMEKVNKNEIKSILELGAGYGRTAYVFLKMIPNAKYIIVDIPPALYVAERYLSHQFRDRKIFKFRDFKNFSEIKEEFDKADIAFFLPYQLALIPPNSSDLFINISSFHEMRHDQIEWYFNLIDAVIRKYVYIKEWKTVRLRYEDENTRISEKDYPIREKWKEVYWRECRVKTKFFEALFKLNKEGTS